MEGDLQTDIDDINGKIPAAASPQNQLADKEFVNSSIASNTGNLQGNYNLVTDLGLTVAATDTEIGTALASEIANPGNNDYCFVGVPVNDQTPDEISVTKRFKYNSAQQKWVYEYSLNNSTFTAAQFDAINSGITAALVAKLGDLPTATALAQQISTAISTALTDYYTKTNIDTLIANYSTTAQMTTAIAQAIANYYTKTEIDTLIADYYTKSETDTLLSEKQTAAQVSSAITAALADYSTTTQMTTAISQAIATALADYSTTADMNTAISGAIATALADYSTSQQVAAAIAAALEPYATQQQVTSAISTALTPYYTKTEIDTLLTGYATTGALSSHTGNTTVHITAAERTAWNAKQAAITDGAQIGLGYGTSSDTATTQARTATIASFILLKNMFVTVRFTTAVNVSGATLNISSTGAKPLYIQGAAMQPGIIKKDDVVTMIYDGTNWNIVEILSVATAKSDLVVDMGLPSGRLWAIANIDMTTQSGFAEVDDVPSPYKYECTFFSWGNTEGHNPSSTSAFSYDWGSGNDGPYASTPGAQLTADAGLSFDAARAILGGPWRDPSTDDFAELFNSAYTKFIDANGDDIAAETTNKLVTISGIVGIRLKSIANGNTIFFPCSGYGYGQSWNVRGSGGNYWSRSLGSQTVGRYLGFYSGGVDPQNAYYRFGGFTRRAVQ